MDFLLCRKKPVLGEFRTVFAHQLIPTSERNVAVEDPHRHYADNVVVTSKYKLWNFFPKNLFEQFRRVANFYFLCIVIVQFGIGNRAPVSPITSLLPLVFVITVTAVKQAYEDFRRHQADNEVNKRSTVVIKAGAEVATESQHIQVGNIVKVVNDEELPCDMVVLSSCNDDSLCYITTANLDGETNLKARSGLLETASLQTPSELGQLQAKVECDHPEYDMYKFNGRIQLWSAKGKTLHALGPSNLLLRGSRLKNTAFVYGLAVYTGKETKMALNQKEKTAKFSSIEKAMNTFLLVFLGVLVIEAVLCTGLKFAWQNKSYGHPWYHLENLDVDFTEVVVDLLSFLVLFNYIIPISLYVTIELQKFFGALFFNWDLEMYHKSTDEPAKANTSDLNEELGQVEYVFSDKTGTLTENDMQFRQCSVGGVKYVEIDQKLYLDGAGNGSAIHKSNLPDDVKEFLIALALCHTVQADKVDGAEAHVDTIENVDHPDGLPEDESTTVYKYTASSPDEKALCEAAARFGIVFKGKSMDYLVLEVSGVVERYKILHVLDFDSTRKRMSVILQTPGGKILMLCKGAESAVIPRCNTGQAEETLGHIDSYAELGLRTLTIVSKVIPQSQYVALDQRLTAAQQAIGDREEQLAKAYDEIETDFCLLGATAVEDKLQDGVKATIESLREAGIKVWVLTGDKLETAVNISHSCGHFRHGMDIMYVTQRKVAEDLEALLDEYRARIEQNHDGAKEFAVVVDGPSLVIILNGFAEAFLEISQHCVAVLCCRMSPLQKAQVVKLVKGLKSKPITLAIGDGANDCSMIQEAHVGCGIMGKEGRQAVRCSDYAFHRFRYLKRVLLVHGHYYYTRLATVVQYFFYKNVAFITPAVYFQFACGFSSQALYSGVFLTCYNIFFTSLPILFYGVFEQDLKAETLMTYPALYRDLSRNSRMSWMQFMYWMLSGIWHSIMVYVGGSYLFSASFSTSMHEFDLFAFGTAVFTMVVLVAIIKLSLLTHFWTWMTHLMTWGSILTYLVFVIVICAFFWPWPFLQESFNLALDLDMYDIIFMLFATVPFWLGLCIVICLCLLPDVLLPVLVRYFYPTKIHQYQFEEAIAKHDSRFATSPLNRFYMARLCPAARSYTPCTELDDDHRRKLEENLLESSLYFRR